MRPQEIVTAICALILIGIAISLYLLKNAALDPEDGAMPLPGRLGGSDLTQEGKRRQFFNIAVPLLVIVLGLIVLVSMYENISA